MHYIAGYFTEISLFLVCICFLTWYLYVKYKGYKVRKKGAIKDPEDYTYTFGISTTFKVIDVCKDCAKHVNFTHTRCPYCGSKNVGYEGHTRNIWDGKKWVVQIILS